MGRAPQPAGEGHYRRWEPLAFVRAFITGISGFVGRHLASRLAAVGHEVSGLSRGRAEGLDCGHVFQGDLNDPRALAEALEQVRPDWVFHLAGATRSGDPAAYYAANVVGTVRLLEAVHAVRPKAVVVVASSSAVYGEAGGENPIDEAYTPRPISHYGASKLAQEIVAQRYHSARGMHVVCTRTFNLLGPDLPERYACSAFARQIARAERSHGERTIRTGHLDTARDFIDVRDAVQAYVLLAQAGAAGETYNVAREQAVPIRLCLEMLIARSTVALTIEPDPERLQANDVMTQTGLSRKLREMTGWSPFISLGRSLDELLDYWRMQVNQRGLER